MSSPAAVKPLTRAWANWPAPISPTLILLDDVVSAEHRWKVATDCFTYDLETFYNNLSTDLFIGWHADAKTWLKFILTRWQHPTDNDVL